MSTNRPDCKTADEAMAQMLQAITEVPADAVAIETAFSQRYPSAGGGWYWRVSWHMSVETGNVSPRVVNKLKATQDAIRLALGRIAEIAAAPTGGEE